MMDIKEKVCTELEKIGILLPETCFNDVDIDLNEYIEDSLQFISFIVLIEEAFDIHFPDDELVLESLSSLNAFCETISMLAAE